MERKATSRIMVTLLLISILTLAFNIQSVKATGSDDPFTAHDIAVTNIAFSKTVVGQGSNTTISITVKNLGNYTETFNVTVHANTSVIYTLVNFTLTNRTSTFITFTWNTAGFAYGNYTITAKATPVAGETDTTDNTRTCWVLVTVVGDVNGDCRVSVADMVEVGIALGTKLGEPNHNPNADVNEDDRISIADMVQIDIHLGETCPEPARIYFDRSIYYPDVKVFWEPNLPVPIGIRLEDEDVNGSSVKVDVSSSIGSKEVTLTKDILGVFSGTVFAVGVGLAGGPISNASILNVRYGDEIIAEYFDMSSGKNFTASALFMFPYYIMQTELPGLSNWESVSICVFDSNGVPMIYIGGSLKYNPVTIGQYALANYYTYLNEGNLTRRERFLAQAKWFVENAKQRGNFSVWEHYFNNPAYGCTDPFVSAFAQGVGLSVLVRAYALTGNMSYIDVAENISLAFGVEMSAGGVRYTDSDGVWFEECADEGAWSGKVLNGFMFALTELYEYLFETNNSKGWTFFWEGAETLSNNIYRYDTGSWSYYDLLYHSTASLTYHKHHIAQLRTMYELTDDETFLYYSDKFQSYIK